MARVIPFPALIDRPIRHRTLSEPAEVVMMPTVERHNEVSLVDMPTAMVIARKRRRVQGFLEQALEEMRPKMQAALRKALEDHLAHRRPRRTDQT